MEKRNITEVRPCQYTEACGYNTRVETTSGDGIYEGFEVVTLVMGETKGFGWSEHAWSTMTPQQARDLAEELTEAADKAESENLGHNEE